MVLNPGKCYYITFGSKTTTNGFVLEDITILASVEKHAMLRIIMDSHLNFCSHLKQSWEKVTNRESVLKKIAPYFSHKQRRLIFRSFFTGQVSCPTLIWTLYSRKLNRLYERALRIIYNNFSEIFEMFN